MEEVPEEETCEPEEKGLNLTSSLLLLAVLGGSPAGLSLAIVFTFEGVGGLVFLFLPISLQVLYVTSIYLLRSARPNMGRNLPRTARLAVFLSYLASLAVMAWWLYQDAYEPTRSTDEILNDVATNTFVFILPIHGATLLLLTYLSSTFRETNKAFRIDLALAVLSFIMPFLNFVMFFQAT